MKISIVSGFFLPVPPIQGGAMEKIWHHLGRTFAAAGHTVTHLSRRWPGFANDETVAGVRYLRLTGADHTKRLAINLLLDLRWSLRVSRALPAGDAVISNSVSLPLFVRRARSDVGVVCVSLGRMPKGQTRFYGDVSWLMAPSEAVAERVRQENPKLASRVSLLPNPIDWPLHAAAANAKAPGSAPRVVGYVGRLHPEKGVEQFLDAAVRLTRRASLPAWQIRIIGPFTVEQGGGGEIYREQLEAKYRPWLGSRLEILGPEFDRTRLAQHYGAMDVFCYPSLAAEGEGLSVAPLEAMAARAVPVLSQLSCYDDVVEHGRNGMRFDHRAPPSQVAADLADSLERLLQDDSMRQRLAAAAQQSARRFDYSAIGEMIVARLESLRPATRRRAS